MVPKLASQLKVTVNGPPTFLPQIGHDPTHNAANYQVGKLLESV